MGVDAFRRELTEFEIIEVGSGVGREKVKLVRVYEGCVLFGYALEMVFEEEAGGGEQLRVWETDVT